jgi:pyridoxamine 5'-phosphate oxidase family protein
LTSTYLEVVRWYPANGFEDLERTVVFSEQELAYLAGAELGRLATVRPDGSVQVSPVGFAWNPVTRTVDVGGFTMSTSQKYRNVLVNPRVAIVVDDIVSRDPWRVRCLEIRGTAEAVPAPPDSAIDNSHGRDHAIIRIHPVRIISFGVDRTDQDPEEMTAHNRTVAAG